MLSNFFSNFGRPWLKLQRPVPDPKNQPDDSNIPDEDKDEPAAENEDLEVKEEQLSSDDNEREVLNEEIENLEVRAVTAVEIQEVEQPEQTMASPGETTLSAEESEVPAVIKTASIDQEVSFSETGSTPRTAHSGELDSKNEGLLQAPESTFEPQESTVEGFTQEMEGIKDETEPVVAVEEEVAEAAQSPDMSVLEMEPNPAEEAAVENQVQVKVIETQEVLAVATIEEKEESVAEIQPSEPEIRNLEALEAKMENLVAAMKTQKLDTDDQAADAPVEGLENVDITVALKEAQAESIVKEESAVSPVASLAKNDKESESPAGDAVLPTGEESVINSNEEALSTSAPPPVLEEETSGESPVKEVPTNPLEQASSTLAIATDTDGKEENELAFVQPEIAEISDEVNSSSSEKEEHTSESVGHSLDKDTEVRAPVEGDLSHPADSAKTTQIFNVAPGEDVAEINAVLRKYGVHLKRNSNSEDLGDVTVKITKQ